jgi:hypothetical protein
MQNLHRNCLVFYDLCSLTRLVQTLEKRGETLPQDVITDISLYLTEHTNRFGITPSIWTGNHLSLTLAMPSNRPRQPTVHPMAHFVPIMPASKTDGGPVAGDSDQRRNREGWGRIKGGGSAGRLDRFTVSIFQRGQTQRAVRAFTYI